jgi:hypothetical protein
VNRSKFKFTFIDDKNPDVGKESIQNHRGSHLPRHFLSAKFKSPHHLSVTEIVYWGMRTVLPDQILIHQLGIVLHHLQA